MRGLVYSIFYTDNGSNEEKWVWMEKYIWGFAVFVTVAFQFEHASNWLRFNALASTYRMCDA